MPAFTCPNPPSAGFSASAPSNRNLALVRLQGSNQTVVRDITDVNHPSTVAVMDIPDRDATFASATDVSWVWIDRMASLYRQPFAGSARTVVVQCAASYGWSPDGSSLVYLFQDETRTEVHQLGGGRDRLLGSQLGLPAVGCESQSCVDNWDFRLSYSPDGTMISLVESVGVSAFRVWTADGRLLKSVDSSSPMTMSVWSGSSLYFRDAAGVQAWRNGAFSPILSGVAWIRPKAAPGGGQIVYTVRESSGLASVNVLDIASGKARLLARSRTEPIFLTSRYVWYRGERLCGPGDQCPLFPTIETGKTYLYDLQTGIEAESTITDLMDVWPHPA